MIILDLLPGLPVMLDDRTASLGGSFYYDPLRVYDPIPLQWAYDHLRQQSDPVLIDIGASTGCFSLLAAHLPLLIVHAFEPAMPTVEVLRANRALNGLDERMFVLEMAVSDYDGAGVFNVVGPNDKIALSMLGGNPADYKECVSTTAAVCTIDSYCDEFGIVPTVIKIDTEGNELAVLRGAEEILASCKPIVIAEYSVANAAQYGYHPDEIVHLLEVSGYRVDHTHDDDILALPEAL